MRNHTQTDIIIKFFVFILAHRFSHISAFILMYLILIFLESLDEWLTI
jgi:hypothetical protein